MHLVITARQPHLQTWRQEYQQQKNDDAMQALGFPYRNSGFFYKITISHYYPGSGRVLVSRLPYLPTPYQRQTEREWRRRRDSTLGIFARLVLTAYSPSPISSISIAPSFGIFGQASGYFPPLSFDVDMFNEKGAVNVFANPFGECKHTRCCCYCC